MTKKSFCLFCDCKEVFNQLPDEQAGQLIKAIFDYETGEEVKLNGLLNVAFIPIRQALDRNRAAYIERCEKNKANAEKRWNNNANACERINEDANDADNDSDKDSGNETETDISITTIPYTKSKTLISLNKFILDYGNGIDPEKIEALQAFNLIRVPYKGEHYAMKASTWVKAAENILTGYDKQTGKPFKLKWEEFNDIARKYFESDFDSDYSVCFFNDRNIKADLCADL